MKLLQFIPIKLTLLLILGITTGYFFDMGVSLPLTLTLLSLTILGFLFFGKKDPKNPVFGLFAAITTLCLGVFIIGIAQPKNDVHHYSNVHDTKKETWKLKVTQVLAPSSFSERFVADVLELNSTKVSGKILLTVPRDSTLKSLNVDDELVVLAKKEEITPSLNPHQFDYKNYMELQGIYHQLKTGPYNSFVLKHPKKTFLGGITTLRNTISTKLKQANFGKDEYGIIQALFLGQRSDISESTYNAYKNAGAVHILAVSGLHIGILLLFLEFLLRPLELLRKGKEVKLFVIVVLLWGFAFLAGLSASVIRAVTMFSFVAYALYLNRPSNTFNILALSMFFILLVINPLLLFHVGFQMSYAAVLAIVWVYPLLQKIWRPKYWLAKKIWQLLSVSIAAQLGVLPISLYYFHQFPGLFFLSNILIVPFLGLILGMGIIVIALVIMDLAPEQSIILYNNMIRLMNTIIDWVAQQEAFIFRNISFDLVQLVLTYTLLIALVWLLHQYTYRKLCAVLVCIITLQIWSLYKQHQTQHKEQLLVAHQTKNSIVMHRFGERLTVYTTDSLSSAKIVTDYKIGENIAAINFQPTVNSFNLKNGKFLIIDSLGVYPQWDKQPDYVLLTQSPKINLERLIDSLQPKAVIADGSNYRSYINRWKATCAQRKLPIHYTGEQGCFELDLD
ncbi:ComEC/Rec2 family competence protein [Maribacter polysiphoniae]|uniref:ComEC/Rec2 family competence protein n=1 Tax=Maribacter polysiphoniae TaxID=429344 RepID=UPI002356066A|nr:ComEC/Rec2 family competence protein [Maribacter polysiphoniae]